MTDPADLTDLDRDGARGAPGFLDQALDLCRRVVDGPSRPLDEQDCLFAELDGLILGDARLPDRLLESPCFRRLHDRLLRVRAAYEYERERALARAIIAAGDPSPVDRFRSAAMYRKTHAFESRALAPFDPQRILFIGCGPFPITAIAWLQEFPDAAVTCLERLEEGYDLAREVAAVFGCADLDIRYADGLNVTDFESFDAVHVGTVVGVSAAEKAAVTAHFVRRVPRSTLLVFRTAVGPGRVIYPRVDPESLGGLPHRLLPDPPQRTYSLIVTQPGSA